MPAPPLAVPGSKAGTGTDYVRLHGVIVHHSLDIDGVYGNFAGGEQVGSFANLRGIDAGVVEALALLGAGEDVDGKVACEPEQVFSAGDVAQVTSEIAESFKESCGHAARDVLERGGLRD